MAKRLEDGEYLHDPEEQKASRRSERCTPEKLLAFLRRHREATGREADLKDVKKEFGGIIGPWIDYWTLQEKGLV